jgi:hypothetical protein
MQPIKITRQTLANEVSHRWESQYRNSTIADKVDIGVKLKELGDSPDPDKVDEIIGNRSWTRIHCDSCNKEKDAVIQLGEEQDYESATANVCVDCLREALSLCADTSECLSRQ